MITLIQFALFTTILTHPPLRGEYYLDPGSGSFLLQLILASILGALFVFRGYLGKIKSFFTRRSSEDEEEDEGEE